MGKGREVYVYICTRIQYTYTYLYRTASPVRANTGDNLVSARAPAPVARRSCQIELL